MRRADRLVCITCWGSFVLFGWLKGHVMIILHPDWQVAASRGAVLSIVLARRMATWKTKQGQVDINPYIWHDVRFYKRKTAIWRELVMHNLQIKWINDGCKYLTYLCEHWGDRGLDPRSVEEVENVEKCQQIFNAHDMRRQKLQHNFNFLLFPWTGNAIQSTAQVEIRSQYCESSQKKRRLPSKTSAIVTRKCQEWLNFGAKWDYTRV